MSAQAQQTLYQVQDAGGAGKCFFYSLHDSIVSREKELVPKQEIFKGIYTCFGISQAQYNTKATEQEKKDQFNQDIRHFVATKIREEPSGFQWEAEQNFLRAYAEANNKAPLEQTRVLGAQNKNNYPGFYDMITIQENFNYYVENNELFELQRAGAVSPNDIQAMGRRGFYNLVAQVLEANQYSTYVLEPIIALLNYYLGRCAPQGYSVKLLFPTSNLQQDAGIQYVTTKNLLSIPVFKTGGAHYQAILTKPLTNPQQRLNIAAALYDTQLQQLLKQLQADANKDVNAILSAAAAKDPKLDAALKAKPAARKTKYKRKSFVNTAAPLYTIPQDFFTVGQWYKSVEETDDGIPYVEPFHLDAILPISKTKYDLSITMRDGTKTTITIDNDEGHFVTYTQMNPSAVTSIKSAPSAPKPSAKQQTTTTSVKPKTLQEFTKLLESSVRDLDIESAVEQYYSRNPQEKARQQPYTMEEFTKKLGLQGGGATKKQKSRYGKKSRRKTRAKKSCKQRKTRRS